MSAADSGAKPDSAAVSDSTSAEKDLDVLRSLADTLRRRAARTLIARVESIAGHIESYREQCDGLRTALVGETYVHDWTEYRDLSAKSEDIAVESFCYQGSQPRSAIVVERIHDGCIAVFAYRFSCKGARQTCSVIDLQARFQERCRHWRTTQRYDLRGFTADVSKSVQRRLTSGESLTCLIAVARPDLNVVDFNHAGLEDPGAPELLLVSPSRGIRALKLSPHPVITTRPIYEQPAVPKTQRLKLDPTEAVLLPFLDTSFAVEFQKRSLQSLLEAYLRLKPLLLSSADREIEFDFSAVSRSVATLAEAVATGFLVGGSNPTGSVPRLKSDRRTVVFLQSVAPEVWGIEGPPSNDDHGVLVIGRDRPPINPFAAISALG